MHVHEFQAKWRDAAVGLSERAAAQSHFTDLCRVLGQPATCFETFPFPCPTEEQRQAIAEAAKELDDLRQRWLNPEGANEAELKKHTLTNLYNQRPSWLANAHAKLDRAVWSAYGWPEDPVDTDDETILARLLALNLERAEDQ